MAAIVGLGFSGHWLESMAEPDPHPAASDPVRGGGDGGSADLVIVDPVEGSRIEGPIIRIRGTTTRPLGWTRLSVRMGDLVLGWGDVDLATAGTFEADVTVFAPRFAIPVEVSALPLRLGLDSSVGARRSIVVRQRAIVAVSRAAVIDTAAGQVLAIDGIAASEVPSVGVSVPSAGAAPSPPTWQIPVRMDLDRPGAAAGALLGLESFHGSIALPARLRGGCLRVRLTWVARFDRQPSSALGESWLVACPPAQARS